MKSALALGLLLGLIGFVPLLGGPRYEAALLAGLIAPLWVALFSAWEAHKVACTLGAESDQDQVRRQLLGARVTVTALTGATLHLMAVLLIATVHGIRTGFCEPAPGYTLLVLGAGLGMALSSMIGALSGTAFSLLPGRPGGRARFVAMSAALAFPCASILLGLIHFYESPAVYAYNPFVGYFAGPLYDTVEYDLERLLSFRAGTLATLGALACLLQAVTFRFEGSGGRRAQFRENSRPGLTFLVLGLLFAFVSIFHSAFAEEMTHSSSTQSISESLGRFTERGRCKVRFSGRVEDTVAVRVAEECVGHLVQLERYFEVEPLRDVTIFLFADADEKRLQMGAGRTYIAKPWRREIYITPDDFPHQVLGHELAHVVTGEFGAGPLRIAGLLGGLIPDPGRIEGFAEAASPREHSEGTLHEWTAAMHRLELLPELGSLFQLTFLQSSAARSYSAAGSFVDFVRQKFGADVIKLWYAGGDLAVLTNQPWSQLEEDWLAFLGQIKVPTEVMEIARPRFSRPGVFERRCPHAVDRKVAQAFYFCPLQETKARAISEEAIALDPTRLDLRLAMDRCAYYGGDAARSEQALLLGAANETTYETGARRGAYNFAGDIAWQKGRLKEARAAFESARVLTFSRDELRQTEVKLWALDQPKEVRDPLRSLLAEKPKEYAIPLVVLTSWMERGPESDLAKYLLARLSLSAEKVGHAAELIDGLDIEKLPLRSLRREARRMALLSACRTALLGADGGPMKEALLSYKKEKLGDAELLEATRVAERCEIALTAKQKPQNEKAAERSVTK